MQYLKHIPIRNKVYQMDIYVYPHCVFISSFSISPNYRGSKYSYRIFESVIRKYKRNILLECFHTCLPYYKKLGFEIEEQMDEQGYYTMSRKFYTEEATNVK